MPFSDFYLIFYLIFIKYFFIKKIAKRGYLPAGDDVASGSTGELTCGAQDHRVCATRR